ncbi:MAG TPA: LD-carboxypeptidase [Longimicrobium sp.]|jgi:muramoyltetrapeptide carboxypeptidase|uniref:S66 peptidase family protein n=1 Tax=Longimicrobium sp. TaxID=2029185 RepID=UPI002ED9BBD9
MIRPPALRPGSRIALVAGAGPLPAGGVARAVERVRQFGWEPVPGASAEARHGYLAGTDQARAADLNAALRDPAIDAIWFLRGGYGTMRILDAVDWDALARQPRAMIGFSDNTAVHLAAQRAGVVSFHGPHPHTPEFPDFARDTFLPVMTRAEAAGVLPFPAAGGPACAQTVTGGVAEGLLVGGNLALLAATLGTPFAVQPDGAILFLEEVGEHAYRLDRLLTQLRLAGVLNRVAGVAVGAVSEQPDAGRPDVPLAADLVRERLGDLGVPVAMGFPFGHVDDNWTLPLGVRARLDADAGTLALLEPAVAA